MTRVVPPKSGKMSAIATEAQADSQHGRGEFEKDETEERLEKLIFGDEAGFLDALKPNTPGQELFRSSSPDGEEEGQFDVDEDLEGVADEDVRSALTLRK